MRKNKKKYFFLLPLHFSLPSRDHLDHKEHDTKADQPNTPELHPVVEPFARDRAPPRVAVHALFRWRSPRRRHAHCTEPWKVCALKAGALVGVDASRSPSLAGRVLFMRSRSTCACDRRKAVFGGCRGTDSFGGCRGTSRTSTPWSSTCSPWPRCSCIGRWAVPRAPLHRPTVRRRERPSLLHSSFPTNFPPFIPHASRTSGNPSLHPSWQYGLLS